MKLKKLVSDEIESFLNKAVLHEYTNGQIYFGIASWCSDNGFNNTAEVFNKWAEEEHGHGQKVKDYIDDRNAKIVISALDKPAIEFKDIMEILLLVFDREVSTEDLYKMLSTKALREADRTTFEFCTWFINEQIEEIVKIRKLIDFANLIGVDNPMLKYFIEKEFEELLD